MTAVLIRILFAQQIENGCVGERHARTAKELSDDNEEEEKEEDFADVVQLEDGVGECGRDPIVLDARLVIDGELERVRRDADSVGGLHRR